MEEPGQVVNKSSVVVVSRVLSANSSDNTSDYDGHMPDTSSMVLAVINLYVIPLIITLGIFGNLLSFVIFIYTYLRTRSSSYYLAALSITDTCFLVCITMAWLENALEFNFYNRQGVCQCVVYVSHVSSFLSVWFIVAFTAERFIAICYPLQRPTMCTVARAKMVIGGLTTFAGICYLHVLWTTGVTNQHDVKECQILLNNVAQTWHYVFNYFDTIVTLLLPFISVLVFNCMITRKVMQFNRKCRNRQAYSSANNSSGSRKGTIIGSTQMKIAKMTVIISSAFLILNFPSYALRMKFFIYTELGRINEVSSEEIGVYQYFNILYYINFSINFILYSIWGVNFRKALVRFCKERLGLSDIKKRSLSHRYK